MSLPIFDVLKPNKCRELLCGWSIYFTVLRMIGRSTMNETSTDMSPYRMLLNVKKQIKKDTTNILFRIDYITERCTFLFSFTM